MSSSLLLAVAFGLLSLAFLLALVVLVGVLALFWLRSDAPSPPKPAPPSVDPVERERRKNAARGRAPAAGPPRVTAPTELRPSPVSNATPALANRFQSGPMIGFFDDETSTGLGASQARKSSLSSAFLSTPPSNLLPPEPISKSSPSKPPVSDDSDTDATEIFSANTLSADLAALLDEPSDAVAMVVEGAPARPGRSDVPPPRPK